MLFNCSEWVVWLTIQRLGSVAEEFGVTLEFVVCRRPCVSAGT